jgi:hypothetical protein
MRTLVRALVAEHRAAEAARLASDLARVHEMRDGQQAAEQHELCDRAGG